MLVFCLWHWEGGKGILVYGNFDATDRAADAFRLPAIFNLSFLIHKFALADALHINSDASPYTRAWRGI